MAKTKPNNHSTTVVANLSQEHLADVFRQHAKLKLLKVISDEMFAEDRDREAAYAVGLRDHYVERIMHALDRMFDLDEAVTDDSFRRRGK